MLHSFVCAIALMIWCQGNVPPPALTKSDCLNAAEQKRLSAEAKVDGRIKVYRAVSERLHLSIQGAASKQKFEGIPVLLQCWKELLSVALKDIEANINRKKKSGALINFEIQVRKSIIDMDDARLKAPTSQLGDFDAWISQAKTAHERFVDILFQR